MFKKMLRGAALGTLLLFGVSACASSASNTISVESGGDAAKTDAAANQAADTAETKTASDIKGSASVPAKRANLTLADREKFLNAVGLPDEAEGSASLLTVLERDSKTLNQKVENAAMKFYPLGGEKYLVEITTDRGARTDTFVYALYQETTGKTATAKALKFDSYSKENGKTVKGLVNELIGNPVFDEKSKILTIAAAARGTGGCGSYAKYKFTNDRAETIEARYSECGDDYDTPPEKWEKLTLITGADSANDDLHGDDANEFEHIQNDHAAVLKKYLKTKSELSPAIATDYDRANPKLVEIRKEYQKGHPYYVAGDFNRDGKEDFAVILKSKKAKNSFRLAVFNGPLNQNNGEPAFSGVSDYRYVLQIEDEADMPALYIGSYASDDGFSLEPSGKGYKVVTLLE